MTARDFGCGSGGGNGDSRKLRSSLKLGIRHRKTCLLSAEICRQITDDKNVSFRNFERGGERFFDLRDWSTHRFVCHET